jgi:hypothetical protein
VLTRAAEFRRGWGAYEAYYLLAKLAALLVVAVLSPDNCLFRTLDRGTVAVVRQAVLVGATLVFFGVQCALAPFLDPVGNASEFASRLNYVLTAALSLLVALDVPGQDAYNGIVLYVCVLAGYRTGAPAGPLTYDAPVFMA